MLKIHVLKHHAQVLQLELSRAGDVSVNSSHFWYSLDKQHDIEYFCSEKNEERLVNLNSQILDDTNSKKWQNFVSINILTC